jgi:hypothetical protein
MQRRSRVHYALNAIVGGALGCSVVVASAFSVYPGIRDVLITSFPVFRIFMGGPGLVGGLLIARLARHRWAEIFGFGGIILGVFWHLHLSGLSAQIANASHMGSGGLTSVSRLDGFFLTRWFVNLEYAALLHGGLFTGLLMLTLPMILGLLGVYGGNRLRSYVSPERAGRPRGSIPRFAPISERDEMLLPRQVEYLKTNISSISTEVLSLMDTSDEMLPECAFFVPNLLAEFRQDPQLAMIHGLGTAHAWVHTGKLREILSGTEGIRDYSALYRAFVARGYHVKKVKYIRFRSALKSSVP